MEWERRLPFMQALRSNLLSARDVLLRHGYAFSEEPVAPPSVDQHAVIDQIEQQSLALPATLRAFYEVFGRVEFSGSAPQAWANCEYPDPISIVPLDLKFWRSELEHWREAGEGPFTPQFAGDAAHKAGFSGGSYHFLFDGNDDPVVIAAGLPDRFTAYLSLCNAWGGFPGLRDCAHHTWPLDAVKHRFVALN